jgi:hypothetical protein
MTMKPIMQPQVEIIPFPLECASGRISSATMNIMAPAAKAKPIGRIVDATDTARAPEDENEKGIKGCGWMQFVCLT